ncbi:hypothetical protein [Paenibacillus sp. NAIST15-1]|uniref:hypothetical protein n=1 Tax=Paenibacillus sp. NAIST15-1 TaxID=1605994 RepID=UPI00086BECB5|nr:hypothetical protein [Paenibacillus sp. NAIST15-1]GAV11369.1 hypothetical protein PBN151_1296 [Paenibacillus sp. NAIST15-1]
MKYTLQENGIDSLKATYVNIEKMHNLLEGIEHCLKDCILTMHHSIEILFKSILKDIDESLIFSNRDRYEKAKEAALKQKKKDVFEVNPTLRTITLFEAVELAENECDLSIPEKYKVLINYLNKIRNQLTHYGIEFDDAEVLKLTVNLQLCYEYTINFFKSHIAELEKLLNNARFEMSLDEYESNMSDIYADMAYEEHREERLLHGFE